MQCSVCGGDRFSGRPVLWQGLIDEWQISMEEVIYVDRQQGETCNGCGANLRSIALANAIRGALGTNLLLRDFASSAAAGTVSILEINEAGNLTPTLRGFGRYVFGAYPQVDMHALPYENESFDVVVHSDTLEHIPNPVHALSQCRRVLRPGGALCYTVPTIVGRLSRDRAGLPRSFHGDPETATEDMVVHTEFGSDAWTYAMQAGFSDVTIHSVEYPCASAMTARNGWVVGGS
jgi:SAM-dependent methyltransferase